MTIYSKDLRERAFKYTQEGHTYRETAEVFSVGTSALVRWKKIFVEQGNFEDKPRKKRIGKIDPQKLEEYLKEHPDAYLKEIAALFGCSEAAVSKMLKRMNYTKKKKLLPTKSKIRQK